MPDFHHPYLDRAYRSEVSVAFGQLTAAITDAEPDALTPDQNLLALQRIKGCYKRYCAATKARGAVKPEYESAGR